MGISGTKAQRYLGGGDVKRKFKVNVISGVVIYLVGCVFDG